MKASLMISGDNFICESDQRLGISGIWWPDLRGEARSCSRAAPCRGWLPELQATTVLKQYMHYPSYIPLHKDSWISRCGTTCAATRLTMCKTTSLRWISHCHLPIKVNNSNRIVDEMRFHTRLIHPPKWVAVGNTVAFTSADRYTAGEVQHEDINSKEEERRIKHTINSGRSLQITIRLFRHGRVVFRLQGTPIRADPAIRWG